MVTLIAGCAWVRPAYQPEPEPVQYSHAPLPPTPAIKAAHDQVTILPKKDGPIGGVVVRSKDAIIVLDEPYASALILEEGRATKSTYDAERAKQDFAEVLAALPGKPTKFTLFFFEGNDELIPQSDEEIARILADLDARPVPEILVIGHTDAVGGMPYNDKLSLQRAERVRALLIQRGVPGESIQVEGRGKREPIVLTPDGMQEPKNRRVEINVR
ncbi:MAG: OmpA family protein [Betaproteobacteria bacterium]